MLLAEGIVGHSTMVLYCIYRIAILGIQARVSRVYVGYSCYREFKLGRQLLSVCSLKPKLA